MRRIFTLLLSFTLSANCFSASIAARVTSAEEIEKQDAAKAYLFKHFFPELGPGMQKAMQECAPHSNERVQFTLVADVDKFGAILNVDFEPKGSAVASCFATAFSLLKAPPPDFCEGELLPISIKMKVGP